jgi:hypothetical protein
LPLWVVCYAGVIEDWVATPLRRRVGGRAWGGLVVLGCLGLIAANGAAFARHQRHLETLRQARDAFVARVPAGSLVVFQGALVKIVGTPVDVPEYRFRQLEFEGKPVDDPAFLFRDLDREPRPWFLGALHRTSGERVPITEYAHQVIERYRMERVAVGSPLVSLFIARPDPDPEARP